MTKESLLPFGKVFPYGPGYAMIFFINQTDGMTTESIRQDLITFKILPTVSANTNTLIALLWSGKNTIFEDDLRVTHIRFNGEGIGNVRSGETWVFKFNVIEENRYIISDAEGTYSQDIYFFSPGPGPSPSPSPGPGPGPITRPILDGGCDPDCDNDQMCVTGKCVNKKKSILERWWFWVMVGAVVLVFLIVMFLILRKKK